MLAEYSSGKEYHHNPGVRVHELEVELAEFSHIAGEVNVKTVDYMLEELLEELKLLFIVEESMLRKYSSALF